MRKTENPPQCIMDRKSTWMSCCMAACRTVFHLLIVWFPVSVLQCGAGLQAAGGQAAAADDEALPYAGRPLRLPALPPGGLHLHPETQVQSRLQEARSLETLVPVRTQTRLLAHSRCTGFTRPPGRPELFFVHPSSSVASHLVGILQTR